MDWPTVFLILGAIGIFGIVIVGGNFRFSRNEISIDSGGFLEWLLKARESKGMMESTPMDVVSAKPAKRIEKLPRATIAWVDDKPQNNVFERRALASAGVFCDSYANNADAIRALEWIDYDLIISDIGREDPGENGWDLLAEAKKKHPDLPFVFYTWGITDDTRVKAAAEGADGITEMPDKLAQLVFSLTT